MSEQDNLVHRIRDLWRDFSKNFSGLLGSNSLEDQALSMPDLYAQVWDQISQISSENDKWYWLTDVYMDGSSMFAILAEGGKLYRANLEYTDDHVAIVGDLAEVVVDFKPVGQGMSLIKQSDGSVRCLLVAATTVLNRNGGFNSQELYDILIQELPNHPQPYIDFFHLGKDFDMGTVDFLARDKYTLVASFVFNESDLAKKMIQSIESDPEFWGSSISFWPTKEARMVEVAQGMRLPCYDSGWLESIALLPENDAKCLFTAIISKSEEVNRMDNRVLEALKKVVGDDEELLNKLADKVDQVNGTIESENLLHQSSEVPGPEDEDEEDPEEEDDGEIVEDDPEDEEEDDEEDPESEEQAVQYAVDDEVVAQVSKVFAASEAFVTLSKTVSDSLHDLAQKLDQVSKDLAEMRASSISQAKKFDERLKKAEISDEEKHKQYLEDMPASPRASVTYRPREQQAEGKRTSEEIARETLALLEKK